MNLAVLCAVLSLLVFVEQATGHKACTYDTVSFKRSRTDEKCRASCANYTHPRNGRCFAYVFYVRNNYCQVYVFDTNAEGTPYQECGANANVDLTLPSPGDAQPSLESYTGCNLSNTELGVAPTKEQCEALCTNFDPNNQSGVYGGCAAWFWNPEYEKCTGLLSSRYAFSGDICGFVN